MKLYIVNGRESLRFSPGTSFINPIVEKVNEIVRQNLIRKA